jgi:L-rhamnose-H+ transport protein
MANPFLGVVLHAIGGFAAGSFYLPIKKIKQWSWESAWLMNGIFAWLVAPITVAMISVPNSWDILSQMDMATIGWTYFFGVLWGIGGLTFGLALRYLGISLGMAIALGLTAAFGTLIPPLYDGTFGELLNTTSGQVVLLGVVICLVGIAICGKAGMNRDKDRKNASGGEETDLTKGLIVAIIAGILSACFAFGLVAGKPIADLAVSSGASQLWQNSPVFVVILAGGFTSNFIYCATLNIKNKTYRDYAFAKAEPSTDGLKTTSPLFLNYLFAIIAGCTWYCQFMFYGMGSTQMGDKDFASWTLHMAFIIFFSTLLGILTKEWNNTSRKTKQYLAAGLCVLVISTIVIGLSGQITSH